MTKASLKARMRLRQNDRGSATGATIATGVAVVVVIALVWFVFYISNTLGRTDGGHVAVVRNGGPFDNNAITEVLAPNSGINNIGYASSMHMYPTSQRYFTISATGSADSNDVVHIPTADGVSVGIEGTAYFTMNTSSANNYAVLKDFDNKYGTRNFPCTPDKDGNVAQKAVWNGDDGFACFLDAIVSPVINNDLRQDIGDLRCADLVASCSLVQNSTAGGGSIDPTKIGQGNVNLSKIENDIRVSLQADLNRSLGGNYLTVENFNLKGVDLPPNVQAAIDSAQASFAAVTKAQAAQKKALIDAETRVKQAQLDAQANEERQKGYNDCPTCAAIDQTKALPPGITVYAPGGNSAIAIPTK